MTEVTFLIPLPPSANRLFPTAWKTGRRFKSTEYKNWETEAGFLLLKHYRDLKEKPTKHTLWEMRWSVFLEKGHINRCDLDNFAKPLHDIMSKVFGLDDRYLLFFYMQKIPGTKDQVSGLLTLIDPPHTLNKN